jgi:hypothetical protein
MTYSVALSEAQKMQAEFRKVGVPCSIELVPGRGADPWGVPRKYLRMHHHTASYYVPGGNMTPLLYLVKVGRSDVVGPLANGYGGFDRVYRIICMGEANHPGLGGPITIDGVYIPQNSARGPTWGTEFEGGYQDWENIPGMLEFMGRCDVALANYGVYGTPRPLTSQMEHSTWAPTRKIDRRNINRTRGIALTTHWANQIGAPATQEEEDMRTVVRLKDGPQPGAVVGIGQSDYYWYESMHDVGVDVWQFQARMRAGSPAGSAPEEMAWADFIGDNNYPKWPPRHGSRDIMTGIEAPVILDTTSVDAEGKAVWEARNASEAWAWATFELKDLRRQYLEDNPTTPS